VKKILLVDDSEVLRKIVSFNLKKAGYEVVEAENGKVALERLQEFVPDLMVLDIMMPVMDGFSVLRKMQEREEWKKIPVIVLTAKGGEEDETIALSLGAKRVIRKPFSPSQFLAEVERLLHEREGNP